jgi:ubiquinone/menaquinone biosynthesis C-methylase UbiE
MNVFVRRPLPRRALDSVGLLLARLGLKKACPLPRPQDRAAPAPTEFGHPVFARWFGMLVPKLDEKGAAEHRAELLAGASGRVIEVGAGTGSNFRHYPKSVARVVAVEPEPYLRGKAEESTAEAAVAIDVVDGLADRLPAPDGSFDVAVASLVLCSVPDQAAALSEIRRVLRPGGELRFYEHVAADAPGLARLQNSVAWIWPRLGGGCRPNRDTVAAIEDAGFAVERCKRFSFRPSPLDAPVSPHVIGVARAE